MWRVPPCTSAHYPGDSTRDPHCRQHISGTYVFTTPVTPYSSPSSPVHPSYALHRVTSKFQKKVDLSFQSQEFHVCFQFAALAASTLLPPGLFTHHGEPVLTAGTHQHAATLHPLGLCTSPILMETVCFLK